MPIRTASASPESARRLDRSSWITLTIGFVILALGALVTVASLKMPADGWLTDRGMYRYSNPVYVASLPEINPGLQPGDVLLEVEGKSIELLEKKAATLRSARPANWEIGGVVHYTLLRDGMKVVVPITLQRPQLGLVYRPHILQGNLASLVSLMYLLMGGLLFLLRPKQRAPQLLLLFAIAYYVDDLVTWGVGAPSGVADLFSAATYWPRILMGNMLWPTLILPPLVHLFLIFPVRKRVVRRFSLLIPLIYGVPTLGNLLYVLLSVSGYDIPGLIYMFVFVIPLVLLVVLCLVHNLLTIREPVPRMQMRWIAFGGLVGIAGAAIIGIIGSLTLGIMASYSSGFGLIYLLLAATLPISLAVAVLRYRLWDIEVIINRTLVYAVLTGALALVYLASVILLQWILPAGSAITIVLSTLAISALFSPLRRRIQNGIDRRFYRRKYDARRTLDAFNAEMRDEVELETLCQTLLAVVDETLRPAHVSLWIKPSGQRSDKASGSGGNDMRRGELPWMKSGGGGSTPQPLKWPQTHFQRKTLEAPAKMGRQEPRAVPSILKEGGSNE